MSASLDIHIPVTTKQTNVLPSNPWYTEELREQEKKVRRNEKIWHKYRQHQWYALTNERRRYKAMLDEIKTKCISEKIEECGNDTKKLYGLVNCLTKRKDGNPFPEYTDPEAMANEFADNFMVKIKKICDSLEVNPKYIPRGKLKGVLSHFWSITEEKQMWTINGMPTKLWIWCYPHWTTQEDPALHC